LKLVVAAKRVDIHPMAAFSGPQPECRCRVADVTNFAPLRPLKSPVSIPSTTIIR
jgi:hypothetical protein